MARPFLLASAALFLVCSAALGRAPPVLRDMTVLPDDTTSFQTLRSFGVPVNVLMTEKTFVSFSSSGSGAPRLTPIPASASAHVAVLMPSETETVCYLMFPPVSAADTIVTVPCTSNVGGEVSCNYAKVLSTTSLPVSANWRDVATLTPSNTNQPTVYLFSDSFYVVLQCPAQHCTYVRTVSLNASSPAFAELLSVQPFYGGDGSTQNLLFALLGVRADPSAPALVLTIDVTKSPSSPPIATYVPAAPTIALTTAITNNDAESYFYVSAYNNTAEGLLIEFVVSHHGDMYVNPFAFDSGAELFAAGAVASDDGGAFITTTLDNSGGFGIYAFELSSGAQSPSTVQHGAVSEVVVGYSDETQFAFVGAALFNGSAATFTFESANLAPRAERRARRPLGVLAAVDVGSSCVDPTQPPTCYTSCQPLPQTICGPVTPPPAGFQCFVLPTHPDACNNCPLQYQGTCN